IVYLLNETGGDLRKNNIAADIAESFGKLLSAYGNKNPNYLRSGINNYIYKDPQLLPKSGTEEVLVREPHSFSRVFFGAIYDIFVMIYEIRRTTVGDWQAVCDARNTLTKYITKAVLNAP